MSVEVGAGEPRTLSTRPSSVTFTRSSLSAARMPSTAWRQRTCRYAVAADVSGGCNVSRSPSVDRELQVGAHVAQRHVLGCSGRRSGERPVEAREHARRAGRRIDIDDGLRPQAPFQRPLRGILLRTSLRDRQRE